MPQLDTSDYIPLLIEASLKAGHEIIEVYNTDFDVEIKSDNSPLTLADKKANKVISEFLVTTGYPVLSEEGKEIKFSERAQWSRFWMVDPLDGTKEFVKRNGEFTVNIALIENGQPAAGIVYAPVLDELFIGDAKLGAFKIENAQKQLNNKKFNEWLGYATRLPLGNKNKVYKVVASRSHLSGETLVFIENLREEHGAVELVSKGSSLKLCMVAEGNANIYPRFAPTMEWDTAAGHAVIAASGGKVIQAGGNSELAYNKENLLNPWFIANSKEL